MTNREALDLIRHIHAGGGVLLSTEADAVIVKALDGWQPIETAAKDGTPVLVWGRYDDVHISAFDGRDWISRGCDGAAIRAQDDFGTKYQESGPLSHWMPLPAPPGDQS